MCPMTASANKWLRYATAVTAFFWALAAVAGCHLPHLPRSAPQLPTMSATAMGHAVAAAVEHVPPGAHPCAPMDRNCQQAAQACATTDLVALAVAAALTVVFASPAWPVVSTPRGPPRPDGFVPHRPGRIILLRHCIARI